jgi:hypothetical protein
MIYREEMYRPGQGVGGAIYHRWLRFVDMRDAD